MLLCILFLLNWACKALRVDLMVSTLSTDSLQMGAIKVSYFNEMSVLQQVQQKLMDLVKRLSTSVASLTSGMDLQYLISCCKMLGNSHKFFNFSRSLLMVSSFCISFLLTEKVESIFSASYDILSIDFSRTLSLSSTAQMLSFISRTVSILLINLLQFSNTKDWIS